MNERGKTNFSIGLVILTVLLTVYAQVILKWRIRESGPLPISLADKVAFLAKLLLDPGIISGMFAAFVGGLFWMAAMTRVDLSYAYPFMSLAFVLVLFFSAILFHEAVTVPKVLGLLLIIAGLIVASRG